MPAAPPADATGFSRPRWMFSPHIETIAAALGKQPVVHYTREIISTRDDDKIVLDYIKGGANAPLLVMFHGLEGCSQSNTLRLLARGFADKGWTVAVPHFRSCGGLNNRLPRAYHAADGTDVEWMLAYCRAYFAHSAMFAAGVSLGGSALMHHLVSGKFASPAVVISAPFDLAACVKKLDGNFFNRSIYIRHFLKSLRPKVIEKSMRFPSICNMKRLKKLNTIGEFDDIYTAPVHGFKTADNYWSIASAGKLLKDISTPLLCINALNDPFIPASSLPAETGSAAVKFCRPAQGGHGAFIGEPSNWLVETTYKFFDQHHSDT